MSNKSKNDEKRFEDYKKSEEEKDYQTFKKEDDYKKSEEAKKGKKDKDLTPKVATPSSGGVYPPSAVEEPFDDKVVKEHTAGKVGRDKAKEEKSKEDKKKEDKLEKEAGYPNHPSNVVRPNDLGEIHPEHSIYPPGAYNPDGSLKNPDLTSSHPEGARNPDGTLIKGSSEDARTNRVVRPDGSHELRD
jgi:hypothetical protein